MSFSNAKIAGVGVDPNAYHAQTAARGAVELVVSPSVLKLFYECPRRWIDGYEPPDSKPKQWGSVLDCLTFTPKQFEHRFAVKPATYPAPVTHADVKSGKIAEGDPLPWNGNAKVCRAWLDEMADHEIVDGEMLAECQAARGKLLADPILSAFLAASDYQLHLTAEWTDRATGLVIPVQCLIDIAPRSDTEFAQCLGDLKSTRSAAPRLWRKFAYQMAYHRQAAFDLDLYNAATGEQRDTWCFVLVENFVPYTTGREMLSQRFRRVGMIEYQKALALYARCLVSGSWPSYDDHANTLQGWTVMEADERMDMAALAEDFSMGPEEEENEMPESETAELIP